MGPALAIIGRGTAGPTRIRLRYSRRCPAVGAEGKPKAGPSQRVAWPSGSGPAEIEMIGYLWVDPWNRPVTGGPQLVRLVWVQSPTPIAVWRDRDWAVRYGLTTVVEWVASFRQASYRLCVVQWKPAEAGFRLHVDPNWYAPYGEAKYASPEGSLALEAWPHRACPAGEVELIDTLGLEETVALLRKAAIEAARDQLSRVLRLS
jgi:hypothetical protein